MAEKLQKDMVKELYQAVVGIPENPNDNGLIGDVKELIDVIKTQNTRIRKNEVKISKIWGIMIGVGAIGGTGLGIGIKQILGG